MVGALHVTVRLIRDVLLVVHRQAVVVAVLAGQEMLLILVLLALGRGTLCLRVQGLVGRLMMHVDDVFEVDLLPRDFGLGLVIGRNLRQVALGLLRRSLHRLDSRRDLRLGSKQMLLLIRRVSLRRQLGNGHRLWGEVVLLLLRLA